jgi:hypothetical protein
MPDEQKRLREVDRQIAAGHERIIQQKRCIADLQRDGHSAAASMARLRELEHSLHLISAQRRVIASRLKRRDFLKNYRWPSGSTMPCKGR